MFNAASEITRNGHVLMRKKITFDKLVLQICDTLCSSLFLLVLFIHFFTFGYAEFSPPHGLSLVAVSRGLLSSCRMKASHCGGFSFGGSIGSGCTGFGSCSRAWGQWVWCKGLGAPRHVGSSWISVGTHVSCIGRQILYH